MEDLVHGVNIQLAQRVAEEENKSQDEPVQILNQCTVEKHALAFYEYVEPCNTHNCPGISN